MHAFTIVIPIYVSFDRLRYDGPLYFNIPARMALGRVRKGEPLDPPGAESWCEKISGLADYHQPVITNPGGTDRTGWVDFI